MLQTDNLTTSTQPRLIAAHNLSAQEEQLERALRPKTLADYIGQHKAKEQLAIFIAAAKMRITAVVMPFAPSIIRVTVCTKSAPPTKPPINAPAIMP